MSEASKKLVASSAVVATLKTDFRSSSLGFFRNVTSDANGCFALVRHSWECGKRASSSWKEVYCPQNVNENKKCYAIYLVLNCSIMALVGFFFKLFRKLELAEFIKPSYDHFS